MSEQGEAKGPQAGGFSFAGFLMIAAGLGLAVWAFNFDVAVTVPARGAAAIYDLPDRVANADLLAQRTMMMVLAAAFLVSGWIVVIGSVLHSGVREISARLRSMDHLR